MVCSIAAMAAGQEAYYLELARDEYYRKGGEPPGQWHGAGARALGLSGTVSTPALSSLFRGLAPDGKFSLVQQQVYRDGRSRQPGWDVTFSPPKSVSVFWSQTDVETRAEIESIQRRAVEAALDYLEAAAAFSRTGKGGTEVVPAQLVIAMFEHGTSRAQDPQLHTHALVLNAARRPDGSWGTLRSRDLYIHRLAADALYQAELARLFQLELGLEVERDGTAFRLPIVPKSLEKAFSQRRQQIVEALGEFGWSSHKATDLLALQTRSPKGHAARSELFPIWHDVGRAHDFGPTEAVAPSSGPSPAAAVVDALREGLVEHWVPRALAKLTKYETTFTERDLIKAVGRQALPQPFGAETIRGAVEHFLSDSRNAVAVATEGVYARFTTRDLARRQQQFEERVRYLANKKPKVQAHEGVLEAWQARLSSNQCQALRRLTTPTGALSVLLGASSQGRSEVLAAAKDAWENAGYNVLMCGATSTISRRLERDFGLELAPTVRGLVRAYSLYQRTRDIYWHFTRKTSSKPKYPINRKTVIVVDGAEALGTQSMDEVLRLAQLRAAGVVVSGDTLGIPPHDPGQPLQLLQELVVGAHLQSDLERRFQWLRNAVHELKEGNSGPAFQAFLKNGRMRIAESVAEALEKAVTDWVKDTATRVMDKALVVMSQPDRKRANRSAQVARIGNGELDTMRRIRVSKDKVFYEGRAGSFGDRVRFNKGNRSLGTRAGDRGSVERIDKVRRTITVRLDRKRPLYLGILGTYKRPIRVTVSAEEAKEVLELDYAQTMNQLSADRSQKSFVVADPSRTDGRDMQRILACTEKDAHFYTDKASAGDDLVEFSEALDRAQEAERRAQEERQRRGPERDDPDLEMAVGR